MKLRDYLDEDKPREKLIKYGVEYLSDSELLCILLRTGNKNKSVNELSSEILKKFNGFNNMSELSFSDLIKIEGIKESKATILLAAFEIGKRLGKKKDKISFKNSTEIYEYYKNDFKNEKQEKFYALLFDNKMNLIIKKEIFKGTIDKVDAHPREVFKEAIKESASFIIIMHNHPSGDTTPSEEDKRITSQFASAGEIIGIKVLDHIIISAEQCYSFYDKINE